MGKPKLEKAIAARRDKRFTEVRPMFRAHGGAKLLLAHHAVMALEDIALQLYKLRAE